jgi:transcriptional regulator with XRE-family HTH domain
MTEQDAAADERFGVNLRSLREAKGISQAALAKLMSEKGFAWHQSTVARVERGAQPLRAAELAAAAGILGTTMDRFAWTGAEANEAAMVYGAAGALRVRRHEIVLAVQALLAAREHAERILATSGTSSYQRVLDACTELAADLEDHDLDDAVDEGIAAWENRDGEAEA